MMPLCTTATVPVQSQCGWALCSTAAPWVAQRVWPIPAVMCRRRLRPGGLPERLEGVPAHGVAPAPQGVVTNESHPGRVIAAVLEQSQRVEQHLAADQPRR